MRLVMMGTGTFAEPTFAALLAGSHSVVGLITQPDREVGQERGSTRQVGRGLKTIAAERGIPIFQPESINTPEGVAGLRSFAADLLVVAAYGQILSDEVLAVPGQGGINVHASLLPKYRGAAPVAWAIFLGETRTGVTIIRMSVTLDAGDILAQEALDIDPHETAGDLERRLAVLGSRLAVRVVGEIADGKSRGTKQDKSQVTKAPKLTKEHGRIAWGRHARDVVNHIRAMQPWPTAYTYWHRKEQPPQRLLILKAVWRGGGTLPALPAGHVILQPEPARLFVAASPGTEVEILELQPAGKRRMSAAEYLRGRPTQPGDRLGPELS
jgi:methionyl-tRNA formyltransferase